MPGRPPPCAVSNAAAIPPIWRARIFASTWICYAGYYFCRKPFYINKAAVGDALHVDAAFLGLVGSTYLVAYTAGQFIAGWTSNRFGPRLVLLTGMAVSIVCNAVFGIADSAPTLLGFMALNGLAQATGWSGAVSAMAPWFRRDERGTVMGLWATNFQAGGVLANTLAAFLLRHMGYQYSFFGGSLVLLAAWMVVLLLQRNKPRDAGLPPLLDEESQGQDSNDSASTAPGTGPANAGVSESRRMWSNVLLVGSLYFFIKFIRYALWSWAPYFLRKNYNLAGDDAGYLSTLFDLFGIFGVICAGFISDKVFAGRRAQVSLIFLTGMTAFCFMLYGLGGQAVWIFGLSIAAIGFTLYGPDALLTGAGAIDIGSGKNAAIAAGVINGMGSIGSVVQEILIGDMYVRSNGSLDPIFLLLLGSASIAVLLMLLINLRNRFGLSDV